MSLLNQSVQIEEIRFSKSEFDFIIQKIQMIAGIKLTEKKIEMVRYRILHRIKDLKLQNAQQYISLLNNLTNNDQEWQNFINCLTTNKTSFFREPQHFEFLKTEVCPFFKKNPLKTLNLWCAAASTGEEPYSLAMLLYEELPHHNFQILASDIDTDVLAQAKNGVYPNTSLQNLPPVYVKYFEKGKHEVQNWSRVSQKIMDHIEFQQINLTHLEKENFNQKFDLIFCRNVFIYFSKTTIQEITQQFKKILLPNGQLIISLSESLNGIDNPFVSIGKSIFKHPTHLRQANE